MSDKGLDIRWCLGIDGTVIAVSHVKSMTGSSHAGAWRSDAGRRKRHVFDGITDPEAVRYIGSALAIGLGAIGPGLGLGLAVKGAMEALGRNPEAAGDIRTTLIIGAALAEAVAIYAFVIAIIIAFV
jgi:F-type H+-transporting ATPase subunit c